MSMTRTILPDPNIPAPQQYKKLECIGRGAYGSVHKGVFIPTGEVVALKIINLDGQDDDVEAIQKEVALLSSLRGTDSTNITRYHGCWLEGPHVWIVMDLAQGGSVRTLAKAAPNNSIEERYTAVIMREVLQALAFLHRNNVIHRDLKAANVLISSDGRVMLCDFGVSALLATPHSKRSTFVGTPQWMAPEVILGQTYDTKADIWGLGITLYEMVTGAPPHADQDHMRALMLIPKLKPPKLPDAADASKEMRDFLALCLLLNPNDRLPAEELAKSKWVKSTKASVSILKDLLARYESWTSKGGVRTSLAGPFGALDPDGEPQDFSQPQSWEFDTVRADSFADGVGASSTMDFSGLSEGAHPGDAAFSNPPRSLRVLFEDASNPGADPFRVSAPRPGPSLTTASSSSTISTTMSLDSSTDGNSTYSTMPTEPNVSIDLSSPDIEQHALSVPFDSALGGTSVRRDSTDILTARQANYVFPRPGISTSTNLDTARPPVQGPTSESDPSNAASVGAQKLHKPSFSGSMGLPRSPRPPAPPSASESDADSATASSKSSALTLGRPGSRTPTLSPPRVPSYREVRDSKGLANISIPPAIGTGVGVVQFSGSPETGDPERERIMEKYILDKQGNDTKNLHGQGSGSGSGSSLPSVNGIAGVNTRTARERPPRAKRNATVGSPTDFRFGGAPDGGLVPPSVGSSHGMSRSLDSRSGGGTSGFGSGFGSGGSFGGSGGLLPRPPLLGRQASAMAVLEGAAKSGLSVPGRSAPGVSPVGGGAILKDLLKVGGLEWVSCRSTDSVASPHSQLSPVPAGSLGPGANADMLPPSPGVGSMSLSPVSRVFNPSPSGLHVSTAPTDAGVGTGSSSPVNGTSGLRAHSGGHSQSNSYSATHPHTTNHLHLDVPDLAPLDLGALISTDDVHAELSRTVDGLMAWLGMVDAGLGEVLGVNEAEIGGDERGEGGAKFNMDEESVAGVA
ncbi:hypothetical protein FRC10_001340 [Ceratobasidium sp. 414]|nr:hypothetical protein FRC10_001340 [Ceratobasidium sp. 414]